MIRKTILVENGLGLHARAAAKLVRLTTGFSSNILLAREGRLEAVDSKSILGILTLGAGKGSRLVLSTDGPDEREAWDAVARLFAARFGEEQ